MRCCPTMGGQTALNCALDLAREGVLTKFDVELIGATKKAIDKAEDREKFKAAMTRIGLGSARSGIAHNLEQALEVQATIGFPAVLRPSFTLGGTGGGIAYNKDEFVEMCKRGLDLSPTHELLIEESLLGWKEFEMEVVRDRKDNCIIVCCIENLDPMGVHTGDSITVAPAQTLTDKEYQIMRDASIAVLREIGVDTGGSNVQFAINPDDGRMIVIEMNPRVSRSSALASKATGFPIAKIAAKLAVGYTLDELSQRHHRRPDAGVVRADDRLRRHQGAALRLREVQAGRRSPDHADEVGRRSDGDRPHVPGIAAEGAARPRDRRRRLQPQDGRSRTRSATSSPIRAPSGCGTSPTRSASACRSRSCTATPRSIPGSSRRSRRSSTSSSCSTSARSTRFPPTTCAALKRKGFSDRRLAYLLKSTEADSARRAATRMGVRPVFKRVDTCAAEFSTRTAYIYSTYEEECEAAPTDRKKVMVLGGGPNRIGQGIEFDYCCVHAAMALREDGFETIMVNCNPETVSTDYDTSDRLYFEPLTLEDVLEIVHVEKPWGVIVQYGGQTPLKLARDLERNGVPIIGTTPDMIDMAEDRERFQQMLARLGLAQPPNRTARTEEAALAAAAEIGYPLVVRPSYVLGGRAMEIVHDPQDLDALHARGGQGEQRFAGAARPLPQRRDRGRRRRRLRRRGRGDRRDHGAHRAGGRALRRFGVLAAAVLACPRGTQAELRRQTVLMARALNVVGLMNVQFAIQDGVVYVLEVNPRASRTVPYVSKATGRPLAKIAARCMVGRSLAEQGVTGEIVPAYYSVKEAVFPFIKFPGVDTILGPEMKSTGEVMGVGETFGEAFVKSQLAAGVKLPESGRVFISLKNSDKARAIETARMLVDLGFQLVATRGTAAALAAAGVPVTPVNKVAEGRPHIVDMITNDEIALVVNTVEEKRSAIRDSYAIRRAALTDQVPTYTTLAGARAAAIGLKGMRAMIPYSIQSLHERLH